VVISGLGALMEEKGLSRGTLNTPDMRPTIDGKTKFSDVKGVDEAKVPQTPCQPKDYTPGQNLGLEGRGQGTRKSCQPKDYTPGQFLRHEG